MINYIHFIGIPYGFVCGGWALAIISFPIICMIAAYCMVSLVKAKVLLLNIY
jgi:hypothetical protein